MKHSPLPTIHWVSPLPPARTDIAHYTWRLLPALRAVANVVLWTDAPDWDRRLERLVPVRRLHPEKTLPDDFRKAAGPALGDEAIFVQVGNNAQNHQGLIRFARRVPCHVVLHDIHIDLVLRDMVNFGWYSGEAYLHDVDRWYGPDIRAQAAENLPKGIIYPDMPIFEAALPKALGVIVHSNYARAAVAARGAWPCDVLDLPYPARVDNGRRHSGQGPLRLVQFGYIGHNRQLEQILEALAQLPPDLDYRFDLFGSLWNPRLIRDKIEKLRLGHRVVLRGFAPEAELDAALAQADLVFNLRSPTMGETSGSQLRIWESGAASVVGAQGWYADIPDNTVFRISQDTVVEDLKDVLTRIWQDRSLTTPVAIAGRQYLRSHHSPERYADAIVNLARQSSQHAQNFMHARVRAGLRAVKPAG